jgi:hypothetical protein
MTPGETKDKVERSRVERYIKELGKSRYRFERRDDRNFNH